MRKTINKLFRYLYSFNKTLWFLVFATFMESFGRFLVIPYLSIYLSRKGVSLPYIGVVIGMGPLAAVIFSFIGGHLSDVLGRKPVQIIGVLLSGISFLGFAISGTNLILLAFFNFFTTMTRTFYRSAVNASIADITTPEKKSEALSLSRVSLNLAYGLAPIVGVYVASREKPVAFIIGAIISLLVALFIAIAVPETAIGIKRNKYEKGENHKEKIYIQDDKSDKSNSKLISFYKSYRSILFNKSFLLWTIANILLVGVYGYIS